MTQLHEFLKNNRNSFPNYFRIGELKKYHEQKKLHKVFLNGKMIGFYVIDQTKLKSLFIQKEYRKTKEIDLLMKTILKQNTYLTIAINKNSKRMVKFAKKYNFIETNKEVKGKTYDLIIYEYGS